MLPEQDQFIEKLYRDNFTKFIQYAEVHLHDLSISQDMVQDTFHEAIRHIDKLTAHPNPSGWLMNVLKNKVREYQRSSARHAKHILAADLEMLFVPDHIDTLNEELSRPSIPELIQQIENTLNPKEYQLFCRLIFDNASHLEVAKELGISVYASQKRLERIRKKLRSALPGYVPYN